jgi:PEP-CTERM motif
MMFLMKRITLRILLSLTLISTGLFGVAHAQTLTNGAKSLKIKLPTLSATLTTEPAPTDPKDRVQWGDKKDPIVIAPLMSPSLTTSTNVTTSSGAPATHRSRAQSVPEPATLGLFMLGALALRRRKK